MEDWCALGQSQGWVCPLCERTPASGVFVTDHEHVRGWAGMPPEERRRYIRGLLCFWDNRHVVNRNMTRIRMVRAIAYYDRYEERKGG